MSATQARNIERNSTRCSCYSGPDKNHRNLIYHLMLTGILAEPPLEIFIVVNKSLTCSKTSPSSLSNIIFSIVTEEFPR